MDGETKPKPETKRENVWIYKWDKRESGVFYGVLENGRTTRGRINISYETRACNWILVFFKNAETNAKFYSFLEVTYVEFDAEKNWWCANSSIGPGEFVRQDHVAYGAYVYFNSHNLHKYANFFFDNKSALGLADVACLHPQNANLLNAQYFIQQLRRNSNFTSVGLFDVSYETHRREIYVHDPFRDFSFVRSDFARRPDLRILSFDLEVAITDGRGGFPNGMHATEKVVGISATYATLDGKSGVEATSDRKTKLWLLLPHHVPFVPRSSPADGEETAAAELVIFRDEREMLIDYMNFSADFHVVIGYNCNHFDNNVLVARCFFLDVPSDLYRTDRNVNLLHWLTKDEFDDTSFVMHHQDNVDLLDYFKRYYQGKTFPSYKLDDVAETILGENKVQFKVAEIHSVYTNLYKNAYGDGELRFLNDLCGYMKVDSKLPLDLFFQLNVFDLVNVISSLSFCNVDDIFGPISLITINCIFYRTFYPEKKPFSYERNVLEMRRFGSRWKDRSPESERDLNDYGGHVASTTTATTYQGAHVIDPVPGIYEDVMVFDFASLYPSMIIKYNISPSYVYAVSEEEYEPDKRFYDDHFHVKEMSHRRYNLTPKLGRAPLASIEKMLLEQRSVYKKKKHESNYNSVMEQALKLFSNALYGLTGAQTFISDKEAAATVTAYGRQFLKRCELFFRSSGMKVVYGDTDSVFVHHRRADGDRPTGNDDEKNKTNEEETKAVDEDSVFFASVVAASRSLQSSSSSSPSADDDSRAGWLVGKFHEWMRDDFPKLEYEETFVKLAMISKKCYIGLRRNGRYKTVGLQKKIPACVDAFNADLIDFVFKQRTADASLFETWIDARIRQFALLSATAGASDQFVQMKTIKQKLYLYSSKTNLPHIVFARELEKRNVDLSTLDGHVYYVPVVKDVESQLMGTYYESAADVERAHMTVDLFLFASAYVGKMNSLLTIVYGTEKNFLSKKFKSATSEAVLRRYRRVSSLIDLEIFRGSSKNKSLKILPDVRQFYESWYDFAVRHYLFPPARADPSTGATTTGGRKKILPVRLAWFPNRGFAHLPFWEENVLSGREVAATTNPASSSSASSSFSRGGSTPVRYLSEWTTLMEMEKHLSETTKFVPAFTIVTECEWELKDFLREILNTVSSTSESDASDAATTEETTETTRRKKLYVSKFGVFDVDTLEIKDCVEKFL